MTILTIKQDTSVALYKTPVSPLEDTVKIKEVFREGVINWKEASKSYQKQIRAQSISMLAEAWSVSEDSLRRLEIGFDKFAYTFPMRNWQGEIVGIRRRPYKEIH